MTSMNELAARGQSVWLDFIRRDLIESGELADLVDDGLRGMTSNPTIFQKAMSSGEYDADIAALLGEDPGITTKRLYELLAIADIQMAADALRSVYDDTDGLDGYVSLEVAPDLAHDTEGTIDEAIRLWEEVGRPNLMIKVPATDAGIPAIENLIGRGINVNATLMFSIADYEAVAGAFLRGLEKTQNPSRVASVASFFVSRVDGKVDAALENAGDAGHDLAGTIAVANSKAAYQRFLELFGDDFEAEWGRGVNPQRVLWASTSTKNPSYSDVLYVEELVGPHTVNTMPPATLDAFRDHGQVRGDTVCEEVDTANERLARLSALGIDLEEVTETLQSEGVVSFAASFDDLLATLDEKRKELAGV